MCLAKAQQPAIPRRAGAADPAGGARPFANQKNRRAQNDLGRRPSTACAAQRTMAMDENNHKNEARDDWTGCTFRVEQGPSRRPGLGHGRHPDRRTAPRLARAARASPPRAGDRRRLTPPAQAFAGHAEDQRLTSCRAGGNRTRACQRPVALPGRARRRARARARARLATRASCSSSPARATARAGLAPGRLPGASGSERRD